MGKKSKKRSRRLQYFMLLVLFAAAFLLPAYGARQQTAGRSESGVYLSEGIEKQDSEDRSLGSQTSENQSSGSLASEDRNLEGGDTGEENSQDDGTDESAGTVQNPQKIVIDPGHGGFDSGMVGESGANEKVLNLVYAQKLAALLEAEGFEVVLTRDTEDGLYDADASNKKAQDMERRVAKIAEENPVLTVSIHQNSYPEDTSVKGPQVFYYEQSAEGEKLAAAIQESMNTELEIERPRMQKGNTTYYILKRSVSTTVIVECGFLTNSQEEALLQEEAYQDRAAQAICDGIINYLTEL